MNYLVALCGLLMMAMSVTAMLAPRGFVAALMRWPVDVRFFLAVGIRFLLGIIFLLGASQTRLPAFVSTVGMIAIAAAIVLFFLGRARVDAMIRWWLQRTSLFILSPAVEVLRRERSCCVLEG